MIRIRDILADNLRGNRRKRGITQEQLAEKANVSSHYIAMVETCKTFPKPEMIERLAKTLGIEPYQLFTVENDPNDADERLRQAIVTEMKHAVIDIKTVVREAVRETLTDECKYRKNKKKIQKK